MTITTRVFPRLEDEPVNLLPGPVAIHPEVRAAFNAAPISHRADRYVADVQDTKQMLCALVGARYVELLVGSGTLANDAIAAQLSLLPGRGLILSNGEFGDRLVDQATRTRLPFEVIRAEWGACFDYEQVGQYLAAHPDTRWLWYVLCETSTSVLNDEARLAQISQAHGLALCVDAISAIGTVPVDLSQVYLASGVSGKGLASYPGLALVFYNHPIEPQPEALPRYMDLGYYARNEGVPFTSPSNLLYALHTSLKRLDPEQRFTGLQRLAAWLQTELQALGFSMVAPAEHSSPAVITLALPPSINSRWLGDQLEVAGYLLSYKSGYLLARNWIQICLMGACAQETITPLLELLSDLTNEKARA
ncbi:MAG: alanine--glyoxylate aminotransferase family protein [Ardenticatenales bacterium]|nr:alanine--glyoxylate aminotransferase family protein [Ardenticatenales bacterium]